MSPIVLTGSPSGRQEPRVGGGQSATGETPPGTLKIWRPADLESLELRVGTSFQHRYPRHWHEEFFVSAITAGAGNFHYRGSDHLAAPGTLVLVVPGEVHTHDDCEGGRSFRSIHAPSSLVAAVVSDGIRRADSFPAFPSSMVADARLVRLFLKLHRLFEGRGTRLHRESLLLNFFVELIRSVGKDGVPTPADGRECLAVRRAQDFLNDHYARNVSLGELAALANLSPFYFHRVFCRHAGMPPHAYQIQVRIMRARRLLRSRRRIADVAAATGFADQSHLNRHFKRLVGITPARYAAQGKNVQDYSFRAH